MSSSQRLTITHNVAPITVDPYGEVDYRKTNSSLRENPLLVKVQTGKVKATTYNLPPDGFTYGRRDQFEEEGVKEVVNSWSTHVAGSPTILGRDFVSLNRTAVLRGAVSAKDNTAYRSNHDARLKNGRSAERIAASIAATTAGPVLDPGFVFGRPSKPSTPIHDVLTNSFQRNAIVEAQRIAAAALSASAHSRDDKAGKFGASHHTRASLGHMKIRAPQAGKPFVMEKFKEVQPRVGHQGLDTNVAKHGAAGAEQEMIKERTRREQEKSQRLSQRSVASDDAGQQQQQGGGGQYAAEEKSQ